GLGLRSPLHNYALRTWEDTCGPARAQGPQVALPSNPQKSRGLGLWHEPECLGSRAVAVPLLQPGAVRRRGPGHVETAAAVAGDELEVAVSERKGLPLLIRSAAAPDRPELHGDGVAGGARSARHVPTQPRRIAHHHAVIAAIGRLELPFLV